MLYKRLVFLMLQQILDVTSAELRRPPVPVQESEMKIIIEDKEIAIEQQELFTCQFLFPPHESRVWITSHFFVSGEMGLTSKIQIYSRG